MKQARNGASMDFDFSPEQEQLRSMLGRFLSEQASSARVRAILDGPASHDRELWQGLAELGLLGTNIPEEFGGSGLGYLELCVLAEEAGRAVAPVPLVSSVYLATELLLSAGNDEQKRVWLPQLASGDAIGTLALVEKPGAIHPSAIDAVFRGGRLDGTKQPVADGDIADFAVVAAREGQCISLFLVDLSQDAIERRVVGTIDPLRSHARVSFTGARAERLGEAGQGWSILNVAYNKAAVLIAFEQVGGAERALEMARDYALERMAFGRLIGSYQAIKHMLADMYVEITLARSNALYGAWALSADDSELPLAAAQARVSATSAFRHCARNAIQVHGGVGFTWEHDCHLFYRRANQLAQAIGSLSEWEKKLIGCLREEGRKKRDAA